MAIANLRLTLLFHFVKIMLDDEIKKEIQTAYSALLDAKAYKARSCQKQMIADIANTLGSIEVDEMTKEPLKIIFVSSKPVLVPEKQ